MLKWFKVKVAGEENYAIINSSWCVNRAGITLSFAISIQAMSVNDLNDYGKEFVKAVNKSYQDLLKEYFYAKTETPIVTATPDGEIIMMWSFQGQESDEIKNELKKYKIKQINYD